MLLHRAKKRASALITEIDILATEILQIFRLIDLGVLQSWASTLHYCITTLITVYMSSENTGVPQKENIE